MQLIYLCKISYFVYKFSKKSCIFFTSIRNIGYKILGLNVDNLRERVSDDDKITRKEEVLEKEGNVCRDSSNGLLCRNPEVSGATRYTEKGDQRAVDKKMRFPWSRQG